MFRLIEKILNIKIISKYEYDCITGRGVSHQLSKKMFSEIKKILDDAQRNNTIDHHGINDGDTCNRDECKGTIVSNVSYCNQCLKFVYEA